MNPSFLRPEWPAPDGVRAVVTTRRGGVSLRPWESFNLGTHVGDDSSAVAENRRLLITTLDLPLSPAWLDQVHGDRVEILSAPPVGVPQADAAVTRVPGLPCVVMTADCLPVIFCDRSGTVVAAAHAGWRGLADGILENTVKALGAPPGELLAWLGPAIGPDCFEVGGDVLAAFLGQVASADQRKAVAACFIAMPGRTGQYLADLFQLARIALQRVGVDAVYGGGLCTMSDPSNWYSYRRDGKTGRMATMVWLAG
ncbi:MAG: hypothetical protein CMK32_02325 [Porticoccaceae bacterium]|nr:hypothetical protein [Porticoccaceae bacterium]